MRKKEIIINKNWTLLLDEMSVSLAQLFSNNEDNIAGKFTLKQVISPKVFASLSIKFISETVAPKS